METPLSHGDILHCFDTGEHLLLLHRVDREWHTGEFDPTWDMIDLLTGRTWWEWEFVLDDHKVYERVA